MTLSSALTQPLFICRVYPYHHELAVNYQISFIIPLKTYSSHTALNILLEKCVANKTTKEQSGHRGIN